MFNLAALGAGIGQFAQQQQQERENQVRTLMLQMQLRKFQMEMEADRRTNEAAGLSFDLGGGQSPTPIQGLPQPSGMPSGMPSGFPSGMPGTMPQGANPLAFVGQLADAARRQQGTQPGSAFEGQYGGFQAGALPGGPSIGNIPGGPAYPGTGAPLSHGGVPSRDPGMPTKPPSGGAPSPLLTSASTARNSVPQADELARNSSPQAAAPVAQTEPLMPPSVQDIAIILRQKNPTASTRAIMERAKTEREGLLSDYKVKHDAWKAKTGFAGDAASRAIQSRKVDVDERQGDEKASQDWERIRQELRRIQEVERAGKATTSDLEFKQKHAGREQAERERANKAREQGAADRLKATVGKTQAKTDVALTEAENLVKDARELAMMIEADPTLVGGPGLARRAGGAASDVVGAVIGREDPLRMSNPASSDFKSRLQLLQSRLGKPLLDARYWSKGEQERMNQLVPALGKWDSPTAARQSLNNIADTLERIVAATRAATGAVAEDVDTITRDEIRSGLPEIFGTQ